VIPVIIPDETLKQAGLTEKEALIEIACGLFDADKLHLWPAAQLAGMSRGEFESELMSRGIAVHRIDEEYLKHELEMSVRSRDPKVDDEHRRQ
jgi:predicted HTH domain antitoxin